MDTINYDKPITNFIPQMDAIGHVTHTTHTKTSVTFHHNAGINTHEQVLNTWRTREASAHFDIDGKGAACQFVRVNEYAWSVGNTYGNQTSISIEMSNSGLGPEWRVSETTWRAAARLAGWLFAHVIKAEPTKDNVFFHHHWMATTCAGPYMDGVYPQLLAAVRSAYSSFIGGLPYATPMSLYRGLTVPSFIAKGTGQYFGLITGPAASHGGYYQSERPFIKKLQQRLIVCGFVPGISNPASGWADGIFEQPTADAVTRFQKKYMPHTQFYGQVWWDDWTKLFNL